MAYKWNIQKAAVEQEILFPARTIYESYIAGLQSREEPFEVLSEIENEDGSLTVVMRKRYNGNAFFREKQKEAAGTGAVPGKTPAKNKLPIKVIVEDNEIAVRCAGGTWYVGETDIRWLWVLNAIAFPEEHSIDIVDKRQHRQEHQPDMTTVKG